MNLEELRKQRERIAQHLQWLDKQISDLVNIAKPEELPPQSASSTKTNSPSLEVESAPPVPADLDLPQIPAKPDLKQLHKTTKTGCLLWAVILSAILILIAFLTYKFFPEWDDEDYQKFQQNYQSKMPVE